MCGFLLKALVMSFTTRCTSTATSSLVSAMLAAAAAAQARLRESAEQPAGVPRGARVYAGLAAPRPTAEAAAEHFRVRPPALRVWSLTRLRVGCLVADFLWSASFKASSYAANSFASYQVAVLHFIIISGPLGAVGEGSKVTSRAGVWLEHPAQTTSLQPPQALRKRSPVLKCSWEKSSTE